MTKNRNKKIGIIGAGASGLAAAVTSSRVLGSAGNFSSWQIHVFEKNEEAGKKILATGNGKCNITNEFAEDFQLCKSFFNDLGILFAKEDEGRMYPHSKQARTVQDALVGETLKNKVKIHTGTNITDVKKVDDGFIISDDTGKKHSFEKLIITTGGKAGIQYGSSGDGFKFARNFGLYLEPIMPVLVAVTYGKNPGFNLKQLKGVRARVRVNLEMGYRHEVTEEGEIQFTDYGLSGICIFNLSRYLKEAPRADKKIVNSKIIIDFAPEYKEEELIVLLESNLQAGLKGIVNEKVEKVFLDAGLNPDEDAIKVARTLKSFSINIDGTKGWKEAQATSGGVSLDQINMTSMESHNIKDLFFAGEVLDYDGPCGGYNLSWAWKTGIQAGLGVINGITSDD